MMVHEPTVRSSPNWPHTETRGQYGAVESNDCGAITEAQTFYLLCLPYFSKIFPPAESEVGTRNTKPQTQVAATCRGSHLLLYTLTSECIRKAQKRQNVSEQLNKNGRNPDEANQELSNLEITPAQSVLV